MNRMRILPLIAVLLLSACGQTGALYLPESEVKADPNTIQATTAAPDKDQLESELKAQNTP